MHPLHVFAVRYRLKVLGIYAEFVSAEVVNIVTFGNAHAMEALIGEAVRRGHKAALALRGGRIPPNVLTVTVIAIFWVESGRASPEPAIVRLEGYFVDETQGKGRIIYERSVR
jgi:hypothetical protein